MLLFDHQKMPSQEALVVNLPPYKEWAGFKWLLQECSLSTTLPCYPPPLTKHLNAHCTVHAPLRSLSRASGISGMPINDGWRGEVSSGSVEANMQRHRSQRGRLSFTDSSIHSPTLDFVSSQAVCSGGTKKDMGVKSAIELYNPVLPFQFFPSDNFQAIEPPSPINWGLCTHLSFSLCLIHQKVLSN